MKKTIIFGIFCLLLGSITLINNQNANAVIDSIDCVAYWNSQLEPSILSPLPYESEDYAIVYGENTTITWEYIPDLYFEFVEDFCIYYFVLYNTVTDDVYLEENTELLGNLPTEYFFEFPSGVEINDAFIFNLTVMYNFTDNAIDYTMISNVLIFEIQWGGMVDPNIPPPEEPFDYTWIIVIGISVAIGIPIIIILTRKRNEPVPESYPYYYNQPIQQPIQYQPQPVQPQPVQQQTLAEYCNVQQNQSTDICREYFKSFQKQ